MNAFSLGRRVVLLARAFPAVPAGAQWCEDLVHSIPMAEAQNRGYLALDNETRLHFVARSNATGPDALLEFRPCTSRAASS